MTTEPQFEVEIDAGSVADVYFDCSEAETPWNIVEALDAGSIRTVRWMAGRSQQTHPPSDKLRGCSGLVCASPDEEIASAARQLGLPVLTCASPASADLEAFRDAVVGFRCTTRLYGFYMGRLERDFAQAREAIRCAVEAAAGMDFLWIDDGCHTTNVESIRERTRFLIQHAEFVAAELTLGTENPKHEAGYCQVEAALRGARITALRKKALGQKKKDNSKRRR